MPLVISSNFAASLIKKLNKSLKFHVNRLNFKPYLRQKLRMQSHDLSRDMRFSTMWYVRPAKAQTSLRIRAV